MAVWLSQHIYYSDRLSAGLIFNSFTNSLVGRKEGCGSRAGMIFPSEEQSGLGNFLEPPSISLEWMLGIARGWDTEMSFLCLGKEETSPILGDEGPSELRSRVSNLLPAKRG